jgi:hypothetical protein
MIAVAVALCFGCLFAAVVFRGWPTVTVTIGDATAGGDDAPVEAEVSTHAIGFALPVPEDDWGDDDGSPIEGCRRSVGFRR